MRGTQTAVAVMVLALSWIPRGTTLTPKTTDELVAALRAATCGDDIELGAGLQYRGNFELYRKSCPAGTVITIRSSAQLPNRRLTPADAALLPFIESGNGGQALIGRAGVSGYKLDGIQFGSTGGGNGSIIEFDELVSHIEFRRLLIVAGAEGQKRAIHANGSHIVLTQSHIANIWHRGEDSQAFLAYNGRGPYTITDNYLEAASENVMFGGADSSSLDEIPADILVEGNHFKKRESWRGEGKNIKNLFELKSAKRVVVRNNIFENNWGGEGQSGYSWVVTPRNQGGAAPWTVIEDVLFEGNTLKAERGFNLLGIDDSSPSGQVTRITIRNNVFDLLHNLGLMGGELGVVTVEHNTARAGGVAFYAGGVWVAGTTARRTAKYAVEKLTWANNLVSVNPGRDDAGQPEPGDGITGDNDTPGLPSLATYAPGFDWRKNVYAGLPGFRTYPLETIRVTPEVFNANVNPDGTLTATSIFKKAASDGTDLGATLVVPPVPTPPIPTPPIPVPPDPKPPVPVPPVDPCEGNPLRLDSVRWPTSFAGGVRSLQVTFRPNQPIQDARIAKVGQTVTLTVTAETGCIATVVKQP